jgi:hypothetical protein
MRRVEKKKKLLLGFDKSFVLDEIKIIYLKIFSGVQVILENNLLLIKLKFIKKLIFLFY